MNIEALEKTRDSVANPENPFDMSYWNTCIAGHAAKVAGIGPLVERLPGVPAFLNDTFDRWNAVFHQERIYEVMKFLGISFNTKIALFSHVTGPQNREQAVAALNRLIAQQRASDLAIEMVHDTPYWISIDEAPLMAPAPAMEEELVGV